jgi:glycerophosphoryl diester phosphodiesterase
MLTYAHRGASAYAPENTRAAFDLGIEMGSDLIETDVHLTSDGTLVLIHDDEVDRTTSGSGPVADHSLAELKALDAGSWFGPEFAGQQILTLEEYWESYAGRIRPCLEIKDPLAADALAQFLRSRSDLDGVEVTSFSWSGLMRLRETITLPGGFLCGRLTEDLIDRSLAHGLTQVCPQIQTLEEPLVARAHERGLQVRAWGIRTREDIDRLFALGVDGATSNWPDWILTHDEE